MFPSRPFPRVEVLYQHAILNCPGKTIAAFRVAFKPNGSTPPHSHAGAFVAVNVVSGYVFNKMNDDPMKVFGPGENFMENPGCRHSISDNASATEPATMVATMIVDTRTVDELGLDGLTVIDEEYREVAREAIIRSLAEAGGKS